MDEFDSGIYDENFIVNSKIVYAMLAYLVRLQNDKHWDSFIREALEEVIYDQILEGDKK